MNIVDELEKENDVLNSIEEGRITLSLEEISNFQSRIKHYLNSFEYENRLNGSDVAKMLGYTNAHYSRLKNIGVDNKIASTLNFWSNLAKLKNMTLSEFVIYADNKPLLNSENQLGRSLWDWEIDMLNYLSKMEPTLRRVLTRRAIKESEQNDLSFLKAELGFSALLMMLKLNTDDFLLVITILKDLIKRPKSKQNLENEEFNINQRNELDELKKELIRCVKDLKFAN